MAFCAGTATCRTVAVSAFSTRRTPQENRRNVSNNVGRKGHKNGNLDDKTMATRTTIYDKVVVYTDGAYVGSIEKKLLLQKMVNF
jgi:hypothetical protein